MLFSTFKASLAGDYFQRKTALKYTKVQSTKTAKATDEVTERRQTNKTITLNTSFSNKEIRSQALYTPKKNHHFVLIGTLGNRTARRLNDAG